MMPPDCQMVGDYRVDFGETREADADELGQAVRTDLRMSRARYFHGTRTDREIISDRFVRQTVKQTIEHLALRGVNKASRCRCIRYRIALAGMVGMSRRGGDTARIA
jgi:hypothetical protein